MMVDCVGHQLGNYQLIRKLGKGGFAEVYLGQHIRLNTQAAVKVLHTQLTSEDADSFYIEARTIARLLHPNIVRVLDFDVEDGIPFLVMDYAPNGSLRERHPKSTSVPLATITQYVKQIADALQYAHDEKLIHRDIKPENMLLGRRNELLLSDFGIAIIAQSSRYQNPQDIAGTLSYMAPEQIQAHPRPASDQYALGIVVYEWLCGERPFHGSLAEIYEKALDDFDHAIELNPNSAIIYYNRGLVYTDLEEQKQAIEDFNQAILLNPNDAFAYYNRGIAYADLNEHQQAITDFNQAIKLAPKNALAYYRRGFSYSELKELGQAIKDFDQAIRLDPNYTSAYRSRGLASFELKEYQQAIQDFDYVLRLDPDDSFVQNYRDLANKKLNRRWPLRP